MINKSPAVLIFLILALVFATSPAHARAARPLVNPAPADWGCALTLSEVKDGIEAGMLARGWAPAEISEGHITASIIVRGKHTLIVDIDYTESSFSIKYKDSKNLKYSANSAGIKKIHPNANSWMKNLKTSIVPVLQRKCG